MNFDHMPELHWFAGYPLALALMVITSITLGQALISQSSYADLVEQLLHDFEHRYTLSEITVIVRQSRADLLAVAAKRVDEWINQRD
ncbi:MAG: magnesium transporter [Pseudonocardiales bacterium]|nr:magnesium transporter [Pseudonocardiales bacterium]